jgi:hypothetical protein
VCAFILLSILLNINYGVHLLQAEYNDLATDFFLNAPIEIGVLIIILWICYYISKHTALKRKKKQ